jgi:hypothetical protein
MALLPGVCRTALALGDSMEAWLLVVLLLLVNYLPELCRYLRKGVAEFCQGIQLNHAELDDQAVLRLLRSLVAALGIALLGLFALGMLGWGK